ncbi:hypothetical protein K6U70_09540, partial [Vibrio vulnificus]
PKLEPRLHHVTLCLARPLTSTCFAGQAYSTVPPTQLRLMVDSFHQRELSVFERRQNATDLGYQYR